MSETPKDESVAPEEVSDNTYALEAMRLKFDQIAQHLSQEIFGSSANLLDAKKGALTAAQLEFGDRQARNSWQDGLTPLTMDDDGREILPSDRFLVHAIGWRDDPDHKQRRQSIFSLPGVFDPEQHVDLEEAPMQVDRLKAMSCSLISGEKASTWDSVGILWEVTNPYGILETSPRDIGMAPTPPGHPNEPQFKRIDSVETILERTSSGDYNEIIVRGSCLKPVGLFVRVFPDGVPVSMGTPAPEIPAMGFNLPGGRTLRPTSTKVPNGLERAQAIREKIFNVTGEELPIIVIPEPFVDVTDKPFIIEHFEIAGLGEITHAKLSLENYNITFGLTNGKLDRVDIVNDRGFSQNINSKILPEFFDRVIMQIQKQYEGQQIPEDVEYVIGEIRKIVQNKRSGRNGYWDYGQY